VTELLQASVLLPHIDHNVFVGQWLVFHNLSGGSPEAKCQQAIAAYNWASHKVEENGKEKKLKGRVFASAGEAGPGSAARAN
jgi:hypothetical protein